LKTCPKCGAENRDIAKFCGDCREPLPVFSVNIPIRKSTLIVVAVIATLIGVICFLAFHPESEKKVVAAPQTQSQVVPFVVSTLAILHKTSTVQKSENKISKKKAVELWLKKYSDNKGLIEKITTQDLSEMVLVLAGEFTMGSSVGVGGADEHPQHLVYLDAFYIDKYPVTFDQYDKFCNATGASKPSDQGWGRGIYPVINVSWDDAQAYAKWAGKRLPTEAEYEKAVRGGTTTQYFFGDDASQLGDYAWFSDNSGGMTHPVGQKKPNPYGLYDIVGNVWEWCSDWYGEGYYMSSPANNSQGPDSGQYRVLRGGSYQYNSNIVYSAKRFWYPIQLDEDIGFRCAKNPK